MKPVSFVMYDSLIQRGRPRRNENTVKLYSNKHLYIGKEIAHRVGIYEGVRLEVGISTDGKTILLRVMKPEEIKESTYGYAGLPGLMVYLDTHTNRYRVYLSGFLKRFMVSKEFYCREGLDADIKVTDTGDRIVTLTPIKPKKKGELE